MQGLTWALGFEQAHSYPLQVELCLSALLTPFLSQAHCRFVSITEKALIEYRYQLRREENTLVANIFTSTLVSLHLH